jgi:uncharacterized protein YqeY
VSLKERIQTDLTAARRSGDTLRRDVLGMVHSALYNAEKEKLQPLTEEETEAVLAREVSQRRDSVAAFRKGRREDLATREEAELAILAEFFQQLTDDQLRDLVRLGISETGAKSPREMRAVMDWLRPRTAGRADGKRVSELVAQALAKADLADHDRAAG